MFYFFAGRYVEEYRPQIITRRLLAVVLLVAAVNPLLNIFYPGEHVYLHLTGDYLLMMPMSVSFFMLCLNIQNLKQFEYKIVKQFSILSLDMYLCCWIFDATIYPLIEQTHWNLTHSLGTQFLIIVPLVVVCSFLVAQLKRWIFDWIKVDYLIVT